MRIISLHCDYIKFKPLKKALKVPEELTEERKQLIEVKEPLVILTAVEKQDESNKNITKQVADEIKKIAEQVKTKNIVLYPYAHLSPSLSKPDFAQKTLEETEKILAKEFKVTRAPFGYYKEFELKCKGHPLAELSREINYTGEVKETEEKIDYKRLLKEISKSKLDTRKLKDNDHRIIGKQMDLFSFNEVAPGMVFWHNNGLIIRNELINFWREEHKKEGYEEVLTPQILDKKLWQISGHWEKYKDNIFLTEYEKRTFAVKPMNCPGGLLIYKNSPKSYKQLPLRVGELGIVHRQELSGVLGGLFRVIQFTQDDAHIFCTEEQLEDELIRVINLVDKFYKLFGFEYHTELSTRPEKRIGNDKIWDKAEKALEDVLKKKKMNFKINKGDGAFYGPKIDFHIKDSLGRTWQCATLQLDFSMPERFELEYADKTNQTKIPIMLHRVIYGSLERFLGILLEHYKGHLPLWLCPIQIRIINFTDKNTEYSQKIIEEIKKQFPEIRIDSDFRQTTVSAKIKEAELSKIPNIIVIGDKEQEKGELAVRRDGKIKQIKTQEFIQNIKDEIEQKK
jgi:threonyl-tRNA synthetase